MRLNMCDNIILLPNGRLHIKFLINFIQDIIRFLKCKNLIIERKYSNVLSIYSLHF